MRPRAVFFDLDDTLIDRAGAFTRYVDTLVSRYLSLLPEARRAEAVVWMHEVDGRGGASRSAFCQQVTKAYPCLGLTPDALWEDMASRLPLLVQEDAGVCDWVASVARCRPVAVVSNGSARVQRTKLARAGLAEVLPDVFLSGEVGASKPDARIFEAALAHVGRSPEEVLHVGDDPERDVVGAARLGMATCWVSHGRPWPSALPPPMFTVECIPSRLDDIAGVLKRWT
ncbi:MULTISPECIES: HAD family hydrolase [Myxococcus]|uniref:Haloacid dehalogenase n=1 Tax=Myxococcus xanthus TaxID=34 RepID=A0AAE6KSB2_MYXXA|nr:MULTISPECIES: HAD family hydrolase [Myxococcus]QDE67990.1 haloacid dehalogenase [Myxococcus xanthus]QDE75267.1 haloacid dehalogenase [Myxococcus xanthus]QDE82570.1 haloacid dehalogenase [Myxococcus xanthus]QDE96841.1 haloacid dehalogenase [Myxococcus xanthus]QDF04370.1 haloacid dehalogenase [Myxococcus xanthus]